MAAEVENGVHDQGVWGESEEVCAVRMEGEGMAEGGDE